MNCDTLELGKDESQNSLVLPQFDIVTSQPLLDTNPAYVVAAERPLSDISIGNR